MLIEVTLIVAIVFILVICFASYIGYPVIISLLPSEKSKEDTSNQPDVPVYIIIPCFNEASVIAKKLDNVLGLKLPFVLNIILVSDASDDGTDEICVDYANSYEQVVFYSKENRGGKNDSLNLVFEKHRFAHDDIVFFTDANTFFDEASFLEIIKDINAGARCVGGSMVYLNQESETAQSEGLYWKYEEWIRRSEAKLKKSIVLNGGLIAMRANGFKPLQSYVPNDFEAPLRISGEGGEVTFNEHARGFEQAVEKGPEEYARKKRMANRQFNCIRELWGQISFTTKVQVLMHKIIRWFGLHLFLLQYGLLLALSSVNSLFLWPLYLESGLVALLLLSLVLKNVKGFSTLYHAVMVHHSAFQGIMMSLKGTKVSRWSSSESNR